MIDVCVQEYVPDSIGALGKELEVLNLSQNELIELPDTLSMLYGLRELVLFKNKFTSMPMTMGALRNLERLDLHNNRLASISNLCNLPRLQYLDLDHNKLEALPKELARLRTLVGPLMLCGRPHP